MKVKSGIKGLKGQRNINIEQLKTVDSNPVSPSDPAVIIAGIKQFGLASDGSDWRDLRDAINRLRD